MVEITYQIVLSTLQTIALVVSIVYYLIIMRNSQRSQQMQLETRQAQLLMQVYSRLDTPEKVRALQEVFLWEFKDIDEFVEKYWNPEDYHKLGTLVLFFGGAGTLVRTGDLPIEKVSLLIGGLTILMWEKFKPIKDELREFWNMPGWANSWEYLYDELVKHGAKSI